MASRSDRSTTEGAQRARRRAAAVAVLAGAAVLGPAFSAAASPTPVTAHRAYGADRYATAATLEDPYRDVAYVVTGAGFADGVTAGALAGRDGSNLFLIPRDWLTDYVRDVIGYFRKVLLVIILGDGVYDG